MLQFSAIIYLLHMVAYYGHYELIFKTCVDLTSTPLHVSGIQTWMVFWCLAWLIKSWVLLWTHTAAKQVHHGCPGPSHASSRGPQGPRLEDQQRQTGLGRRHLRLHHPSDVWEPPALEHAHIHLRKRSLRLQLFFLCPSSTFLLLIVMFFCVVQLMLAEAPPPSGPTCASLWSLFLADEQYTDDRHFVHF